MTQKKRYNEKLKSVVENNSKIVKNHCKRCYSWFKTNFDKKKKSFERVKLNIKLTLSH